MNALKKLLCSVALLLALLCGCGDAEPATSSNPDSSDNYSSTVSAGAGSSAPQNSSSSSQNPSSSTVSNTSSATASNTATADRTFFFYDHLNSEQKRIYKIINSAVAEMKSGMIPLGKASPRDVSLAFTAVRSDYPEYFWMPYSYINMLEGDEFLIAFQYDSGFNKVSYLCSKEERKRMESALKTKVAEIKKKAPKNASDYELELFIHDYIANNTTYTLSGDEHIYTAYGALIDGRALCEGYARAVQLLCNEFGIPATLVFGESVISGENHMWNLVRIGGAWYHLDATWDDDDQNKLVTHKYFNLTDEDISATHIPDPDFSTIQNSEFGGGTTPSYNFALPECFSDTYHYSNITNCILTTDYKASEAVICRIMAAAAEKRAPYCEFYLDYNPENEVSATALAEKYALQKCKNVVNSNSKHKIEGLRVALSGKTFIVFLNYGG